MLRTQGLFNSLQFSSMNAMADADIGERDAAVAATLASTRQQLSLSFGRACSSLVAGFYLDRLPRARLRSRLCTMPSWRWPR